MSRPRDLPRGLNAIGLVLVVNVTIGLVAYFIAFLMAYGFEDRVTTGQHVFFLTEVTVIAVVSALIATTTIRSGLDAPFRDAFAFALSAGATAHLVGVGVGSIVSATHKAENSVSANFSTTTDVAVAAGLLTPALATAWLTWRLWPRLRPS